METLLIELNALNKTSYSDASWRALLANETLDAIGSESRIVYSVHACEFRIFPALETRETNEGNNK